jgi:hypothetical protein
MSEMSGQICSRLELRLKAYLCYNSQHLVKEKGKTKVNLRPHQ